MDFFSFYRKSAKIFARFARVLRLICIILRNEESHDVSNLRKFLVPRNDNPELIFGIWNFKNLEFKFHLPFILKSNNICAVSESESAENPET